MKRNLLFTLFCLCLPALAQSPTGTFVGRVWDASSAAIPGAKITAQNLGTGQTWTVTAGAGGEYVIYSAPPGRYTIAAESQGFKKGVVSEVQMTIGSSVRADFTLEVGAIEQRVEVTARAELQTETAAVESLITNEQIVSMPLNGRDFNQLVLLSAGAVDNTLNSGQDFGSYALNGNRSFSNDFQLDGVPNNNLFQGKSAMNISIDAIREFKVLSADSSAEFGQAGAQITMVTQSGTNKFHGSLYEFNRTQHFQARDPFNTMAIQPFHRNQFGGSIGGPIRRNSTFFFFNYEANRQYENVTRFSFLPPDAFWKGDFSALLSRSIQLRDPLATGRPNIPGNRLDQYQGGALISKTALKLQPFYGSPDSNALTNNTQRFPEKTTIGDQFTIRMDQQLPRHTTLSARTTYGNTGGFKPNLVGTPGVGYTEPLRSRNGSLALNSTLGPRTVNEFRFGAMNFSDIAHYIDGGLPTVKSLGLQGFQLPGENEKDWIPPMPRIVFSGNDAFTPIKYGETSDYGEAALSMINNVFTYSDTFSHQRGAHSMRAGAEFRRTLLNVLQQTNARGQLTFQGDTNAASSGYSFADFLMGIPRSSQQVALKPKGLLKQLDFAGYYQDDWKATSRLTFNLGLRYELFLNPYEIRNRFSNFDPKTGAIVVASNGGQAPTSEYNKPLMASLTNPDGTPRFPLLTDQQAGFTPRRLVDTQKKNFAPRFGFTYLVGKKGNTVVRGGYGIFYTRYPRQYLLQTMLVNPPFAGLLTHSQAITNGVPRLTLDAPYSTSSTASVAPLGLQRNFLLPNNQQWNLTIQREIGWKTVFTLGYIGNKGTHLFRTINLNGPIPDPNKPGAVMRLYQATYGTSSVNYRITDATSYYNSMRVEARKTLSSGLTFQSNWTWAKGLDTTGTNVNSAILDMENRGRDRANSDYVRRHVITANTQYRLPFGRNGRFLKSAGGWQQAVVGGWQVGGIWRYQTGQYLTPSFSQSNALSNNRPDRVLGVPADLPGDQRGPQRWFNPAAFAIPPTLDPATGEARFGNCGRNVVLGPGLNVMDLAMYKMFPLGKSERRSITFRLELFNALNHPNWGNPDMAITNTATVATITRVTVPARQAQFALRFDF